MGDELKNFGLSLAIFIAGIYLFFGLLPGFEGWWILWVGMALPTIIGKEYYAIFATGLVSLLLGYYFVGGSTDHGMAFAILFLMFSPGIALIWLYQLISFVSRNL